MKNYGKTLLAAVCGICISLSGENFSLGIDSPQTLRTETRELQCLNGLWRFRPLSGPVAGELPPEEQDGWGYFKVPGVWPDGPSEKTSFTPLLPKEIHKTAANWHTAWYRRDFTVPRTAVTQKTILEIELIQTRGTVFVDGKSAGEIVFPGGRLDLTPLIRPGEHQRLDIRLSALPLNATHTVAMDGERAWKVAAKVKNKGITGDVFLHVVPATRIENTHFATSVRKREIRFETILSGTDDLTNYELKAELRDRAGKPVKTFLHPFSGKDVKSGIIHFTGKWNDPALWDLHTPENLYTGVMTLSSNGKLLDRSLPERFGFREIWIDGRNYVLNGKVLHLRAYFLPNFSGSWMPDRASKSAASKAYRRLKSLGFNFSISRNYNFAEGSVNYLRGSFEAADEAGYLWSFSMPSPWQFDNKLREPESAAAFAKMSGYLIRKYWNHPSIILYVTGHNRGGAWGDQNPLRIGGDYHRADSPKEVKQKEKGRDNFLAAQSEIFKIDPSRPTYAHAGGSLGGPYSLNCYLNWAPKQERDDWLELFSVKGKYPLSFVEWGLPHIASFSSYRGPEFIWNCKAKMTTWDTEFTASEFGESVTEWTPARLATLKRLISLGDTEFSWSKLSALTNAQENVVAIQKDYFESNLPHLRAWGIGMLLPWDDYAFYKGIPGKRTAVENPDRWKNLNKPGLVPDFSRWGDYVLTPFSDAFELSPLGQAVKHWNQPLIAWIGGEKTFSSKEHNYRAGSPVKKQLVILNDERVPVKCRYTVWIRGINARAVRGEVSVEPGTKTLIPIQTIVPENLEKPECELVAEFEFSGEKSIGNSAIP